MGIYQKIGHGVKILLLTFLATTCKADIKEHGGFDDWIVSSSCSQNANRLCGGYYKQTYFPHSNSSSEAKQPITITSDEANFVSKGTSVFKGNVIATQGDKVIHADRATVVHNEQTGVLETITATGHVKIIQPGLRVDGTRAVANIATSHKVIENAVYRIYDQHARGTAALLTVDGQDKMQLNPASYTTCAPDSNAWYLKANETNFDKETGRGEAWNAKLYVKDVPIFYWPYVNFPIDKRRQTGFLQPGFGSSSLDGKTVTVPFYWNLAPNYDATINTNYMSKRGAKFDILARYLTRRSSGSVNFDFLPSDKGYRALRREWLANSAFIQATDTDTILRRNDLKNRDFRYRYSIKNSTNIMQNLLFHIDYTDASDGDYLNDFKDDAKNYKDDRYSTIYALQRASIQQNDRWGTFKVQLEGYKTFHVVNGPSGLQQLSKLPEISFNSATFDLVNNFNWSANATFTKFRPRIIRDNDILLDYGQRFQIRPALNYSFVEPGWYVRPRVQVNNVQYSDLHISPASKQAGIAVKKSGMTIPMFDLKSGLIFERPTKFRNTEMLQTLEPQLYYLYVPNRNQEHLPNFDSGIIEFDYNQVFRDNRYSGLDRVAEADQLGLGLATKFFRNDTGEEQGMIGVGRIRYLRDKILRLNETPNTDKHWSPWAVLAKLKLSTEYSLEGNWVRDRKKTKTASLQLQYRGGSTKVINLGYEFVRNPELDDLTRKFQSDIKQISVSTAWQISTPVRILGKARYDLRFKRELNILAGLEYHTCCTALRIIWCKIWDPVLNKNRQYNHKVGLQLIFKGLGGGLGNAENRYIETEIPGYSSSG
jgi:LPS-assembly protein